MVRTYEIDLDDELVAKACSVFENAGTDIDSAIKLFLSESVKKNAIPFNADYKEEESLNHENNSKEEETFIETSQKASELENASQVDSSAVEDDDEDEDETCPDNMFDAWQEEKQVLTDEQKAKIASQQDN